MSRNVGAKGANARCCSRPSGTRAWRLELQTKRLRFALQAGRMGTWQWTVRTGTIACPLPSLYAFPTSGGSETLIEGDERRLLP
jgi:hypothetical protein